MDQGRIEEAAISYMQIYKSNTQQVRFVDIVGNFMQ